MIWQKAYAENHNKCYNRKCHLTSSFHLGEEIAKMLWKEQKRNETENGQFGVIIL